MKKALFLLYFLLLYSLCFLVFYYDLSVLSEFGAPGNAAAAALEIRRFLRRRRRLAEALLRLVMTQDLQWFLATIVVLRLPC